MESNGSMKFERMKPRSGMSRNSMLRNWIHPVMATSIVTTHTWCAGVIPFISSVRKIIAMCQKYVIKAEWTTSITTAIKVCGES